MEFGVFMFPTDYSIGPAELARAAEERGFESIFFPEHTHIPACRRTPWPGGDELPRQYSHSLDLFVALTAAAVVTERIKVGSGVCLVIERDPITLAKEVASVDLVSRGRLLFGIGGGWNREEMENHGTDPKRRWKLLRERIEAMQAIWERDEAEYHGEFVDFEPIWSWPKPVQRPHPPILVGGDGERTFKRVLRYGDGWVPLQRGEIDFAAKIAELDRLTSEAGRTPIPVTVFGAVPTPENVEHLSGLRIERAVFPLTPASADEVLPELDSRAALTERFR